MHSRPFSLKYSIKSCEISLVTDMQSFVETLHSLSVVTRVTLGIITTHAMSNCMPRPVQHPTPARRESILPNATMWLAAWAVVCCTLHRCRVSASTGDSADQANYQLKLRLQCKIKTTSGYDLLRETAFLCFFVFTFFVFLCSCVSMLCVLLVYVFSVFVQSSFTAAIYQ